MLPQIQASNSYICYDRYCDEQVNIKIFCAIPEIFSFAKMYLKFP